MRVLYITLEFVSPIFSGNGTLPRAHVRGLLAAGASVFVVCGAPEDTLARTPATTALALTEAINESVSADDGAGRLDGAIIPLPVWRRTDIACAYDEFCAGAAACAAQVTLRN